MSQIQNAIDINDLKPRVAALERKVGSFVQDRIHEVISLFRDEMAKIVRRIDKLEQKRG